MVKTKKRKKEKRNAREQRNIHIWEAWKEDCDVFVDEFVLINLKIRAIGVTLKNTVKRKTGLESVKWQKNIWIFELRLRRFALYQNLVMFEQP